MNPVNINRTLEVEWRNAHWIIDVTVLSIGNNGIGPYEYWGQKCYDRGVDYAEDWAIRRVMDAEGNPVPIDDALDVAEEMYLDETLMDHIQNKLDEYVHDMGEEADEKK